MVVINPVKNMFWGVSLDAGKRYSQTVEQTFHLSMAALEPGSATGNEYVQVMVQRESSEFLICSLHQGKIMQQPLDLIFSAGEELSFSLLGKGTVHLTGYIVEDMPEMDGEYSDEDESDAPELVEMDDDMMKPGMKRKALESALQSKKKKFSESFDEEEDDDDSDEDDSEDFSEDELTFDEDEDSDLDDDEEEEEDDEEEVSSPKGKKSAVTPKGDAGSSKKAKQTPTTPISQKKNNQKQNLKAQQTPNSAQKTEKSPQTPSTPANGESAKKKKNKNKNKDGNTSMNQSTSTPGKSSSESTPKSATKGKEGSTPKIATPGKKRVVAGGTVVEDVKVGHGPEAKAGKMVSVYYVGTLTSNKKQFDSCTSGKPFRFRLKKGEVIKGWDNGVEGMKVGGKRKIVVPANQGYGGQKQGPIPPNSSLSFEVELKAVS